MTRQSASVLAVALAALASAISCSGQATDSREAPARHSAAQVATEFDRLGYRLVVPAGWVAQEGYMDWDSWDGSPHRGTPPFDTFLSMDSDPWIVVGKRQVHDAAPLDEWVDRLQSDQVITYEAGECSAPEERRPTTLGGETAEMLAFHCPIDGPAAVAAQVIARHEDTGWVVMCYSEEGKTGSLAEHQDQCERWLSTFTFAT
jgi:hypothetical protein